MLNYWWVTRPKRKLNSVPEVLSAFIGLTLNQEWEGQRESHLAYEEALEAAGLKRIGDRRDHTGGGARTYKAWLKSLGLIFTQENSGTIQLTLAGEAIMNGESPVAVLSNQIFKYQFPSAFSISRGVDVSPRFKIRPFRFLLKLLLDKRIGYLTEEEIAKIVVTEAENETEKCYEHIVKRLLQFRSSGDKCLSEDFLQKYRPSKGLINLQDPYRYLMDLANTIVNWLDYTQLIERGSGQLRILLERTEDAEEILTHNPPFIDRPEQEEYFQRKYGVDPKHIKDSRNLNNTKTVTAKTLAVQKIQQAYLAESLKRLITKIDGALISSIAEQTGVRESLVEEVLMEKYPHGSPSSFMTNYFEMAFKGREEASEFEQSTVELFQDIFGYKTKHVGPIGLSPDVLLVSEECNYQAILDNKAYSHYSVTNDHHNRMVENYIRNSSHYSSCGYPIAFFSYIAGGFSSNIDAQIKSIAHAGGVNGSCITVSNIIRMVENSKTRPYTHEDLRHIFGLNRQVLVSDLQ